MYTYIYVHIYIYIYIYIYILRLHENFTFNLEIFKIEQKLEIKEKHNFELNDRQSLS